MVIKKNFYTYISYSLLVAGGLLLGQISKMWAYAELRPLRSVTLIKNILSLTYRENTGAAFSILEDKTIILSYITALTMIFFAYILISGKVKNIIAEYALLFITIGGTGNCIDRIAKGFVVDMFEFTFINFAVFNVADIFITCGSVVFITIFLITKGDVFQW